jgi:glycosyltransferase involved in cell wall biosynthesis
MCAMHGEIEFDRDYCLCCAMRRTGSWPRITVVTPSLNQGKYLEETIQSVLQQNYPYLEYIIVDGGSTDGSVDIIRRYQNHLAWWISEPDAGQSDAINKGLARSTGDVFNWISSDDVLAPGALSRIGRAFREWPDAELVVGDHARCDKAGRVLRVSCPPSSLGMIPRLWILPIGQPAAFFSMERIRRMGGVRKDVHQMMDVDLLYRHFLAKGHMKRIRGVIGIWRLHPEAKQAQCKAVVTEERHRLFREYGIRPADRRDGVRWSRCGRLLDGSYVRSFFLTRRLRGRPWQSLGEEREDLCGMECADHESSGPSGENP